MTGRYGFSGASTHITRREQMKAIRFLSACSVAFALMMVAPALAQEAERQTEEGLQTREAQEAEVLAEEAQALEPQAVSFNVRRVAVECSGDCNDVTLGEVCGAGWTPIAIDCTNVQEHNSGYYTCGGGSPPNRCSLRTVSSGNALGNYCDDGSGWDAQVYCAQ
jgi:hypothetical protein